MRSEVQVIAQIKPFESETTFKGLFSDFNARFKEGHAHFGDPTLDL